MDSNLRASNMIRMSNENKRVKNIIQQEFGFEQQESENDRTAPPPMANRMTIDGLLDTGNPPLSQKDIVREFNKKIEIGPEKLKDYVGLYLEYKVQNQYSIEWNAAQELGKQIYCHWDIDTIHVFYRNRLFYVTTNASKFLRAKNVPTEQAGLVSQLQEGREYGGFSYLRNNIGIFDLGIHKIQFDMNQKILSPIEFINAPVSSSDNPYPPDYSGVYWTNNYQSVAQHVLRKNSNLARLSTPSSRYQSGYYANNIDGFVRFDQARIDQEKRRR